MRKNSFYFFIRFFLIRASELFPTSFRALVLVLVVLVVGAGGRKSIAESRRTDAEAVFHPTTCARRSLFEDEDEDDDEEEDRNEDLLPSNVAQNRIAIPPRTR